MSICTLCYFGSASRSGPIAAIILADLAASFGLHKEMEADYEAAFLWTTEQLGDTEY